MLTVVVVQKDEQESNLMKTEGKKSFFFFWMMRVVGGYGTVGARASPVRSRLTGLSIWKGGDVIFHSPSKKEGVDGPLMVFATTLADASFLTDGARRRHSEIHPAGVYADPEAEFSSLSQSIGPFRLPTAPALRAQLVWS